MTCHYLLLLLVAMLSGAVGAWLVARWGKRLSLLDKAGHRSSHEGVIPKGGGIGILAAFFLASWVLGLPFLFWISIGLTALLSLYGDRNEIPPKVRLCVQFVTGIGLLSALFYWEGRGWSVYLLMPLWVIFIVGTANYYNFMDGINGIAGITGIVGFGLLAGFAALSCGSAPLMMLAICMGLACLGFLPFNMPKARVFMGDVGSILLGFVYAALVVGLSHSLNDFVVLCAFLFPFYADELTTEYVRLRDGEFPGASGQWSVVRRGRREDEELKCGVFGAAMGVLMTPHRRHVYQLLANEMGIAHWKVSVGYGVLQLLVGLVALMIRGYGDLAVLGFLGVCFAGFWGFGAWVRARVETSRG